MSGSKKMTVRVQSAEGTARVEVSDEDSTATLYERVHEALRLRSFAFALYRDRARREELTSSKSRQLRDVRLQHGDMLYLSPVNGAVLFDTSNEEANKNGEQMEAGPSGTNTTVPITATPVNKPQEEDVDLELYQTDGHIQRQRDEKLCRHNSSGCCVHCTPLEPWDAQYLEKQNIKHMSFHAYLRKLTTSSSFVSLNELSLQIKPGCTEHPPWPRGICSKCQPGAFTLMRQPWRHVDNVLFDHPALVERFLAYWRATGHQRAGLLLGTRTRHPQVPLGIRTQVSAIYEPPQSSGRDFITLEADPRAELVRALAARLGLQCVGWIFTDLLPDEGGQGKVKQTRSADTHFLSAQECIMAAHFQNQHPSACRYSSTGYYGSKFVTVCVTGDSSAQIHLEGYQVSEQCAALQRANLLLPTRDAPDLGYVRDSGPQQYVPDVYYKERDAYGNEVGVSARRVPTAYLLVDVPCGVAASPSPSSLAPLPPAAAPALCPRARFPPAHRPLHHHLQTLQALHHQLEDAEDFLEAMSDFHTLLYIASNETLSIDLPALEPLLAAVRNRDAAAAAAWRAAPAWATLEHLARESAAPETAAEPSPAAPGPVWTCPLCTFHNAAARAACEMCAMPRGNAM